jgi:hypothetical protein
MLLIQDIGGHGSPTENKQFFPQDQQIYIDKQLQQNVGNLGVF